MTKNSELGKTGENKAVDYLISKGYQILERNYRFGKKEIDIIALAGKILVFIEVKYRVNASYGFPEEYVNDKKMKNILEAAEVYIINAKWEGLVRYDIVSLMGNGEVLHFEDAIY